MTRWPEPETMEKLAAALDRQPHELLEASPNESPPAKTLPDQIAVVARQAAREAIAEAACARMTPQKQEPPETRASILIREFMERHRPESNAKLLAFVTLLDRVDEEELHAFLDSASEAVSLALPQESESTDAKGHKKPS